MPEVAASGQGGLLDVALDPDFASNRLVYLSYAEPGAGGASTAVARGRLDGGALEDVQVIFRQQPKVSGGNHFGSRLVFARDGTLFVTLGERFKFEPAQDLSNHLGTIVRINADGSVPDDNPVRRPSGRQAGDLVLRPPQRPGRGSASRKPVGYGRWSSGRAAATSSTSPSPAATTAGRWSAGAGTTPLSISPTRRPAPTWRRPSTTGTRQSRPPAWPSTPATSFPGWNGNLLIGGLSSRALVRLTLDGERVTGEERINMGTRIRNVRQGPDGAVYLLTDQDDGAILRLTPAGGG